MTTATPATEAASAVGLVLELRRVNVVHKGAHWMTVPAGHCARGQGRGLRRRPDIATVRAEQERLARLFEIAFAPVGKTGPAAGVGSFKTVLYLMGIFETNTMSAPMTALEGENVERVRKVLADVGITLVR